MAKFYADYDGTFISDDFICSFKDVNGDEHNHIVNGAAVYVASFWINKQTGRPVYCTNKGSEEREDWFSSPARPFRLTIDAECGVILIPNMDAIAYYMENRPKDIDDNHEIGFKITGYGISYKDSPESFISEVCMVEESEFKRIIKENFDKFNNSDNYRDQGTSYGYHPIMKEYDRHSYRVGYDKDKKPVIDEVPGKTTIVHFYSSCRTKEKAEEYRKFLETTTPERMHENIMALNRQTLEKSLKELKNAEIVIE